MWKVAVFMALLFFLPKVAKTQSACPEYQKMVNKGQQALKRDDLRAAFHAFRDAQIHGRNCHLQSTGDADKGVQEAFDRMEELVVRAEVVRAQKDTAEARFRRERRDKEAQQALFAHVMAEERGADTLGPLATLDRVSTKVLLTKSDSVASDWNAGPTYTPDSAITRAGSAQAEDGADHPLYLAVVRVLDSLERRGEGGYASPDEDEVLLNAYINRLEQDFGFGIVAQRLLDSTTALLSTPALNADALVSIYAQSAMCYTWNLTSNKNFEKAGHSLDQAVRNVEQSKAHADVKCHALASLYNCYDYYFSIRDRPDSAYVSNAKAILYALRAVSTDPRNSIYHNKLTVLLRNTRFAPDSLLSPLNKQALTALGCRCTEYGLSHFPQSARLLESFTTCVLDQASKRVSGKKPDEALTILKKGLRSVDHQASAGKGTNDRYIEKARIFIQIGDISLRQMKDTSASLAYLDSTLQCWDEMFVKDRMATSALDQTEYLFDDLALLLDALGRDDLAKRSYERVLASVYRAPELERKSRGMLVVDALANSRLGSELMGSKTRSDSLQAVDHFMASVVAFQAGDLMRRYSGFSEDVEKYAAAYAECVKFNARAGKGEKATAYYAGMRSNFSAYYKAYPWDFYFTRHLESASKAYGKYLFRSDRLAEAVEPLELASYFGDKASSELLIEIYGAANSALADPVALQTAKTRSRYQRDGVKKFTIPTQFGSIKAPFDVYVVDRDTAYPYRGVEDQAIWVEQARGGRIPTDAREAFLKLQRLAWKNDVSFGELCVYALEAANEETITKKYVELRDTLAGIDDEVAKLAYYQKVYEIYEYDIAHAEENSEAVNKDAVTFYDEYAEHLIRIGRIEQAEQVIDRIRALDPENDDTRKFECLIRYVTDKKRLLHEIQKLDIADMKIYLGFCLEDLDHRTASLLTQAILKKDTSLEIKEVISGIYYDNTGYTNFKELFLNDPSLISRYWTYFNEKNISRIKSRERRRVWYMDLIHLDAAMLGLNDADTIHVRLASHYNSLAWESFFTKDYDDVLYYLNKSIEHDPASPYPYSNYPHAYLFTGDLDRARELYLLLKDRPFDEAAKLPTYRDAFISDLKEFENEGLMSVQVQEMLKLLNAD